MKHRNLKDKEGTMGKDECEGIDDTLEKMRAKTLRYYRDSLKKHGKQPQPKSKAPKVCVEDMTHHA